MKHLDKTTKPNLQRLVQAFLTLLFLCSYTHSFAQADYHVNANTPCTTGCDGASWTTAFDDLQAALDVAIEGEEIWVAEGIYYPSKDTSNGIPTNNRDKTFYLDKDLKIYGGFPDTGTPTMGDRDWETYQAILSGDLDMNDTNGSATHQDNAYTVVHTENLSSTFLIDGFFVEGGNANVSSGSISSPNLSGGGMYNLSSNPTLTNCSFSNNSTNFFGGGMYNLDNSNPTLTNCSFSNNSAEYGGGMCNDVSNPTLTNCSFSKSSAYIGGGMFNNDSSNPILTNCSFSNNSADIWGGGMCINFHSNSILTNCSFSKNSASSGGGICNRYNSHPIFTNCIIWNNGSEIFNLSSNPTVTYSIVKGGYTGIGNLNQNPLFINPNNNDLRISFCSPAINAGNNSADLDGSGSGTQTIVDIATDLAGNARVAKDTVDMGAYEGQPVIIGNKAYCASDASTTLDVGNWATYNWSNGETTQTIVANAETYTVTVTLPNTSCIATAQVTITENANPNPSISGNLEYCASDNSTTLDAGTWTSYLWSNNATTQTIAATEGTYTVTITNENGCSGTASATVNELNATPVPDVTNLLDLIGQCEVNVTDTPTATDECGTTVSGTTSDPLSYTSQGTYTIVWTYDNGYLTVTQSQTVIVADTELPTIHNCPSDAEYCGAQTVEWTAPTSTDNCSATLTSSHDSGDFFEVGVTTVTYTAIDLGGNTVECSFDIEVYALPDVSISESELAEFCQGTAGLTANVSNPVPDLTFAWTGGLTPTETATAFSNGTYNVTVTDGNGCEGSDTYVLDVAAGSELSQYVILSGEDVDFKDQSMVHSGGVGSTDNKGKIKVEKQSVVHTFAMADKVEIKSGSSVANSIESPSMVSFPTFQYNTFNDNTDFTVSDGQTATITGSHYDKIEVKKNATLYIDASVLYAKEIKTKEGATIHFLQPTEVMLEKGLDLDKNNTFNASGEQVVVYAEKHIQVSENSNVTGVLYTLDHLHAKGKSNKSVNMTGMFLAVKKVKSDKYVNWNWSMTCGTLTAPIASTSSSKREVTNTPIASINMNLYPNPASDRVTIQMEGMASATELVMYNQMGQIVWSGQVEGGQNTVQIDLAAIGLSQGMYLINAIAGDKQVTKRLMVTE